MTMYELYLLCVIVNCVAILVLTITNQLRDTWTFWAPKLPKWLLVAYYVSAIVMAFTGPLMTCLSLFIGVVLSVVLHCTKRGRQALEDHPNLRAVCKGAVIDVTG